LAGCVRVRGRIVSQEFLVAGRVEKSIEGGAAGVHALGYLRFGEVLVGHFLRYMAGEDALDGDGGDFFVGALFAEPVVEAASDVFFLHSPCPYIRCLSFV